MFAKAAMASIWHRSLAYSVSGLFQFTIDKWEYPAIIYQKTSVFYHIKYYFNHPKLNDYIVIRVFEFTHRVNFSSTLILP